MAENSEERIGEAWFEAVRVDLNCQLARCCSWRHIAFLMGALIRLAKSHESNKKTPQASLLKTLTAF